MYIFSQSEIFILIDKKTNQAVKSNSEHHDEEANTPEGCSGNHC